MIAKRGSLMCAIGAVASVLSGQAQSALNIQMTLSKTSVMLGEPVWVNVAVTNRGSEALWVSMGSGCFGERPMKIMIPGAGPAPPENESRCSERNGGMGGSCQTPLLPDIDRKMAGDEDPRGMGMFLIQAGAGG